MKTGLSAPILALCVVFAGFSAGSAWAEEAAAAKTTEKTAPDGTGADAPKPSLLVTGVSGPLRDNVTSSIDLTSYSCELAQWRLQHLENTLSERATQALQALGHYQAEISVTLEQTAKCWQASLDIQPGPPVILGEVDIRVLGELAESDDYKKLAAEIGLRPGLVLNHSSYEKVKQDIGTLASRLGYMDGKFTTHRLAVNPEAGIADIALVFESGERFRFGPVSVSQHILDDEFMGQFIVIKEGEPYDSEVLRQQQQLLADSNYFSDVRITPERDKATGRAVPVSIDLTKRKRQAHRIGIGASTDVGPRFSYSYENRWTNPKGHNYRFDLGVSPVVTDFGFNYRIPMGDAGRHRLDLQAGYKQEDNGTFDTRTLKLGGQITKVLHNGWQRSLSLSSLYEDYTVGDTEDSVFLLMPGIGWNKTVQDSPLFPQKGWRLGLQLRGAHKNILSDTSMAQATASGKLIFPLGPGRVLTRLDLGVTSSEEFQRLPASLRFFTGGDGTVRGFGYDDLGPKDDEGNVIGGRYLAVGSLEYEHPFRENWGVAAFIDAGNAFNTTSDFSLHKGAGVGVRWHSPIGPIRFDVAKDVEGVEDVRFHLSMGLDL